MIYAIIVGAIAGWLAGKLMKGGGFGFLKNMLLGIVGGVVGNWVFDMLGASSGDSMFWDIVVSVIGAAIILAVANAIKKNKG